MVKGRVDVPVSIVRMTVGNAVGRRLLALGGFLVRLDVKVNEQAKVDSEKATSEKSSTFSASTIRPVREVKVVNRCVMLVGLNRI
jgi:hypothetical protein